MNPYTTMGQARIQQRDIDAVLFSDPSLAAVSLAALERQRGCQADTEVAWLLKQHGVMPYAAASLVSLLRQTVGAALVCAGNRLAGSPRSVASLESASATGTLGMVRLPAPVTGALSRTSLVSWIWVPWSAASNRVSRLSGVAK